MTPLNCPIPKIPFGVSDWAWDIACSPTAFPRRRLNAKQSLVEWWHCDPWRQHAVRRNTHWQWCHKQVRAQVFTRQVAPRDFRRITCWRRMHCRALKPISVICAHPPLPLRDRPLRAPLSSARFFDSRSRSAPMLWSYERTFSREKSVYARNPLTWLTRFMVRYWCVLRNNFSRILDIICMSVCVLYAAAAEQINKITTSETDTGWSVKIKPSLFVTSSNIDRFLEYYSCADPDSFAESLGSKFAIRRSLMIPPHLKRVATLPSKYHYWKTGSNISQGCVLRIGAMGSLITASLQIYC